MSHDAHVTDAHAPKGHYRQYFAIFAILGVLTLAEIFVVYLDISKGLMIFALVVLALVKAALVGLYYMHLISETTVLKLTVALPFLFLALYAFVLIAEAAWRLLGPMLEGGAAA